MGSLTSAIADRLEEQKPEPAKPTFEIIEAVRNDIKQRAEVGLKKYGVTLDRNDLSTNQWLQHAYEELLDAACYIKKLIHETA